MANRWGNNGNSDRLHFFGLQNHLEMVTTAMKLKDACPLEEIYDQPKQHIKKQRYYFANQCLYSQSYDFSISHLWM